MRVSCWLRDWHYLSRPLLGSGWAAADHQGRSSTERDNTPLPEDLPGQLVVIISLLSLLGYFDSFHLRLKNCIAFRAYSKKYGHYSTCYFSLKEGSIPIMGLIFYE